MFHRHCRGGTCARASCIQGGKVFQRGGIYDPSDRRRNRWRRAPQKTTKCGNKTLRCSVVALDHRMNVFSQNYTYIRTGTDHRYNSRKNNLATVGKERKNPTTWNHIFKLQRHCCRGYYRSPKLLPLCQTVVRAPQTLSQDGVFYHYLMPESWQNCGISCTNITVVEVVPDLYFGIV